jgi:hypothetical protein
MWPPFCEIAKICAAIFKFVLRKWRNIKLFRQAKIPFPKLGRKDSCMKPLQAAQAALEQDPLRKCPPGDALSIKIKGARKIEVPKICVSQAMCSGHSFVD